MNEPVIKDKSSNLKVLSRIFLIFLAVLIAGNLIIFPQKGISGVSYAKYKSGSNNMWERKAAYLWRNVKIIISELKVAVNNNAKKPPSAILKKAIGSGHNPSSLIYQHNELKQNAGVHFMPPPDLGEIKLLCIKLNNLKPSQDIVKVTTELTKLEEKVKELEKISKDSEKFVKDFNRGKTVELLKQIASKGKDIALLTTPVTAVVTVMSWTGEMATKHLTTMKLPKSQFVKENEIDIKRRLQNFFNRDDYRRKMGKRMLDTLMKLKKGANVNNLSSFEIQEYEMLVRKYNEIIGEIAKLKTNHAKYKVIQKKAEKKFLEKQVKKTIQYISEYKALCAKLLVLTDWTPVKPSPVLSLSKGVPTGTTTTPGSTITYTYTVENIGNVRIENVDISDNKCSPVNLVSGNSDLDPGDISSYECSSIPMKTGMITNIAIATGTDTFGTPVKSTMATVTVTVTTKKVTVPDVRGYKVNAAEDELIRAKLRLNKKINYKKSDAPVGEVVQQKPGPGTKAPEGSEVTVWISEEEPLNIFVDPPRTTIKVGEQVSFTAHLIKEDGSVTQLFPKEVKWNPGPGHIFEGTEAGEFTVTATAHGISGHATVTIEEEERTKWDKPISHSDQLTAKAPLPPPDAYTWYALCNKSSGDVVYGETTDPTKFDVLGGPFPGPRTVKKWIDQNIPSWRCPSFAGKRWEWNVLCDKQSYSVGIGKSTDPTKFWIMAGGFPGEPEARSWVGANCPSWMCTEGGGCASGPRGGGDWAVVCSKDHGGMALTRHPNSMTDWIFASGLLGEKDARLWVNTRCPSWRCNRDGQCMPGKRVERDKPLELPPFDDLYAKRQRLLDEKADEDAMDQAMQMEGDSRTGRPGFTSKGLNKDLDKIHKDVKAECKEDKDCQEGQECKDGKCVQTPTEEIVRLEVDPPEATIPLDGEVTFKAFAILRDGKREPIKAEWNRPNPYKGEAGSDTITATYGEFSKSATITVSDKPTTEPDKPAAEPDKPTTEPDKKEVSLLTITKGKTLVMQDETVTLVATATFKDGRKIKDTATFKATGAIIKLGKKDKKEITTESQEISWNLEHKGVKYAGNWLEVTAKYKDASGNVASDSAMVIVCPPNCHKKRDGSFACCCD